MLRDLDAIIEADPALLPLGVDVGLSRQWLQRWLVQCLKQRAAARAEMPGDTVVQRCDTITDRCVQLDEREEPDVAQLGDNPARRDLHGDLDFCLVARLSRPCW